MSPLRQTLNEYVAVRQQLGYKFETAGRLLEDLVGHLERAEAPALTTELALEWARQPADGSPDRWGSRLSVVRAFARYLHVLDPRHEVPPRDLLPARSRRTNPHLYSDADVAGLMGAAGSLYPRLRAATYETLIGLLAVTGMRVGEAMRLERADVDWNEGLLVVRMTKFRKTRELVLHPTTANALRRYDRLRGRLCPNPSAPNFFVSTAGTRLLYPVFYRVFSTLLQQTGLEPRSPQQPRQRPHDLRHTFAVATMLDWYRAGVDPSERMHLLSTYLGHSEPANTYWYLSAAPELMALAAERLETALGELP